MGIDNIKMTDDFGRGRDADKTNFTKSRCSRPSEGAPDITAKSNKYNELLENRLREFRKRKSFIFRAKKNIGLYGYRAISFLTRPFKRRKKEKEKAQLEVIISKSMRGAISADEYDYADCISAWEDYQSVSAKRLSSIDLLIHEIN
jgi:hypothetical protein